MSELQDNPDAWHEQLAKQDALLEQQKNTAKEKKEQSWGFNLGVLERTYKDKKLAAENRIGELEKINQKGQHDSTISQQKNSYEQDAVLFRLFKHLGEELWEIECKIERSFTNLDERLTHIERFLTDDIKKEEFLENKNSPVQWEKVAEKSADALIAKMSTC